MNRNGFTLIELVMVLVLLGIIAVFVAPRLPDVTTTKAGAFTDKLRADIRYAQNLAMTRNARFRVHFNAAPAPAQGYAVTDSLNNIVPDPAGGGNLSIDLTTGDYTGITITPPAVNPIQFDSLGRLTSGAADSVTVNPSGDIINIADQTGAVN